MRNIITNGIEIWRNFNLFEIVIFKLYLITITFVLAILFPVLLSLNVYIYLIAFVILDALVIFILVKKEWNYVKKVFTEKWYKAMKKFSMFDFALFKITLVSFTLLIAKVFPELLSVNIWIYLVIFWFGAWYFTSKICKK